MKKLFILVIFCHTTLALTRSDRSTTPKKHKYDSDEDYSDTDNESTLPQTSFKCDDKKDGFYADIENGCKSFHYCQTFVFPDDDPEKKDWVFLCPPTLIFRQEYLTCTKPSKKFRCEDSEEHFDVNEDLPPIEEGEVPTLPPPETDDTTEPPVEEETTTEQPTTTTTTRRPKPTTKPPKPKPTTKPPKTTTTTTTEDPEFEIPDSPEIDEESDDSKRKNPENGFLLPPFSQSNFVTPFISLLSGIGKDDKEKMEIPEKTQNKIDIKNPLTLTQYLEKTSWENLDKTKAANKLPDFSNLLKAPLVFPSTNIPQPPLPLFKINEQLPLFFHPHHFDEILLKYNGQVMPDEPIGPR